MSTQVDYNDLLLIQGTCHFAGVGYSVGWFQRWDNTLSLAQKLESLQRILIVYCYLDGTPNALIITVLWPYAGVIQPSGYTVSP